MSQKTAKHKRLAMHPIHFHVGMYVAIAAFLITAMKSSEGVIATVYANAHQNNEILNSTHMREAETHVGHAQLAFARLTKVSGS